MRTGFLFVAILLMHTSAAQPDTAKARNRFQAGLTPRFSEGATLNLLWNQPEKRWLQLELGTIFTLIIPTYPADLFYDLETFDSVGKSVTTRLAYFNKIKPESGLYAGIEGLYRRAEIQESLRYHSTDYQSYGYVTRATFKAYGVQAGMAIYRDFGVQKRFYFYSKMMAGAKRCYLAGDDETFVLTYEYPGSGQKPEFNMERYLYWKPNFNLTAGIGITLF